MDALTFEELDELRNAFKVLDRDQNCTVTSSELGTVFRSIGKNPTEQELTDMIKDVDYNNTGSVEFTEFVTTMLRKLKEKDFKEVFRSFDKDGNGFISQSELHEAVEQLKTKITASQLADVLENVDRNADGKLNIHQVAERLAPLASFDEDL